jgi:hypothetical protein
MILPHRKKLIEVGLPLVAINAESAREKSIRHGTKPVIISKREARASLDKPDGF